MTGSKTCPRCREHKPAALFHAYAYTTNQGKRSMRLHSYCKACDKVTRNRAADAAALREWRAANPDKVREQAKRQCSKAPTKAIRAKLQRMRKAAQRAQTPYRHCPIVDAIYGLAVAYREAGVDVHVDHVQPLARGGRHEWQNLSLLPARENIRKGARCLL